MAPRIGFEPTKLCFEGTVPSIGRGVNLNCFDRDILALIAWCGTIQTAKFGAGSENRTRDVTLAKSQVTITTYPHIVCQDSITLVVTILI